MLEKDITEINKLRNKLNLIQVYCYQAQKEVRQETMDV